LFKSFKVTFFKVINYYSNPGVHSTGHASPMWHAIGSKQQARD